MATETRSPATTFTTPSDREIVMTRVFDAPRELVFKAYTDPDLIPRWWGPRYLTTTIDVMDVRPGGRWRFIQRDAEGHEYAFNGVYQEIVPPERLVNTFEFEGVPGHVALETVIFEEFDGKTKLTARSLFQTAEDRDGMLQSGAEAGATESMERLAELVEAVGTAAAETADREIVMERLFDAPREMVFKAWTDPQQIQQWWGPNGFTTTISEMDVRPGGVWRFVMHGPDGTDYQNKVVYQEIAEPERLVFLHGGGDDEGDEGRFHVTVTFAERGGKTQLTQRMVFPTTAARDATVAFGAVELGYQTLARLAEHLANS